MGDQRRREMADWNGAGRRAGWAGIAMLVVAADLAGSDWLAGLAACLVCALAIDAIRRTGLDMARPLGCLVLLLVLPAVPAAGWLLAGTALSGCCRWRWALPGFRPATE